MPSRTLENATHLPLLLHVPAALMSLFWFHWTKTRLDASYSAAQHPVDYMTGQTTFSGQTIKGHYAAMIDTGTLNIYSTTQLIDFAFILGFALIGIFVCTLIARLARTGSWGRRVGIFAGLAFVLGALSDAIENGWSLVMLADPTGFPDWLAIPYSSFAVLKFALITLGMLLMLLCLLSAIAGRVLSRPLIG